MVWRVAALQVNQVGSWLNVVSTEIDVQLLDGVYYGTTGSVLMVAGN